MCVHRLHPPTAHASHSALALKEPGPWRAGPNYSRGGPQGSRPRASASVKLARSHPCQQLACFLPCTRPPDFALPFRQTSRHSAASGHRTHCTATRAFVTTRTGADVDLPEIRHDMSDDDTTSSPAARSGACVRVPHSEASCDHINSSRAWNVGDCPAPAMFVNCRIKCHEDVLATSGASSRPSATNTDGF
jgi:hypothetical protein